MLNIVIPCVIMLSIVMLIALGQCFMVSVIIPCVIMIQIIIQRLTMLSAMEGNQP
jgi:hypothetical protein